MASSRPSSCRSEIVGYADDVQTYEYDPAKSRQLLQQAGLTLPVEIEFWYPTDVSRDYMPDPKRNFEAFAADLNAAGFKVTPRRPLPGSPTTWHASTKATPAT